MAGCIAGVMLRCNVGLGIRSSVELYLRDACVDLLEQSLPRQQLLLQLRMNEFGFSAGVSVGFAGRVLF